MQKPFNLFSGFQLRCFFPIIIVIFIIIITTITIIAIKIIV